VGLSHIVSCGNQAGVGVEDYLDYLVGDPDTAVIGLFVEGFRRPARLRTVAAAARERGKPIVALKVGRSENARQAMLAHTGSLAGAPEIADAVLRQAGIVQVTSLNEMVDTLTLLAAARAHRGPRARVFVLSGLGGECGHVADAAARVGLDLPPLAPASVAALARFMPDFANPRNPLDGTGAMYEDASLFPRMLEVLLGDAGIDVLAVNLRANVPKPGGWAPSRQFTTLIGEALARGTDKLVVAFSSFAGGELDGEVVEPLAAAGVPFLDGTETAMLALRHARGLGQPPAPAASAPRAAEAPASGTTVGNQEAMTLLRTAGIPLVETVAARDAEDAVRAAERIGYPVALKVDSGDLAHKSDVGGVRLGCADGPAVRRAAEEMLAEVRRRAPAARIVGLLVQRMVAGGVEMILGVKRDPVFGPAVVLGMGGVLVEVLRDVAVRVPPIDAAAAREMIGELRGQALLRGVRGRAGVDVEALVDVVVSVAKLAETEGEKLKALDINPLLVLERGVVAVDWLVERD
jgi:acyl-CoA synthetase (NDP forming)